MNSKEILCRIEEIEARATRATPGPWESDGVRVYSDHSNRKYNLVADCDLEPAVRGADPQIPQDPSFIANAREDIPWLCQTMRELTAQCAAMREALEEIVRTEPDEKPDGTVLGYQVHDVHEMCEIANAALKHDAGRNLLDRFRKLESAARLALQALTEGMADMPAERDKRCAALRVKAKRALREALGLAPREENDGDL